MSKVVERLLSIKTEIKELLGSDKISNKTPTIVIVSKTFPMDDITPLIEAGHTHFGENKVQEALLKWKETKEKNPKIKLHMVGKLQSNKVKNALKVFDYIHSVDNYKLAEKISKYKKEQDKNIKIFVQVNIGDESQKSGIDPKNVIQFVNSCRKNLALEIIGLMGIPPLNKEVDKYFNMLNQLRKKLNLKHLSMGMSNDYIKAIKYESTYLRIGSKILGEMQSTSQF